MTALFLATSGNQLVWGATEPEGDVEIDFSDRIVAVTGETPILLSEVEKKVTAGPLIQLSDYPLSDNDPDYDRALQDAVNFALIRNYAESIEIDVTEGEIDTQLQEILQSQGATQNELEVYLESENISLSDYRDDLKNQILIQKFQRRVVAPSSRVTDQRVREAYQKKFQSSPFDVSFNLVQVKLTSVTEMNEIEQKNMANQMYQKILSQKLKWHQLDAKEV
ncbi:MAG: SurA N-terminal domain-containing protein, partial [Proteobacteria bacterium]|nr:SurA N-terminal domain-containing protein [Pseudomonadota bacterium]